MSEIETLSLLFDSAWYLATYQDVTLANCDPLEHYLSFGYKEGRNPNRFFNTKFYLSTYTDIAECHLNPFIHYILYGASEGRLPRSPHESPLPPITFEVFLDEDETESAIEKHDIIVEENTNKAKETTSKIIKKDAVAAPQKSEIAKKSTKKSTKKSDTALNNTKDSAEPKVITKNIKKVNPPTTKGNDHSLDNIDIKVATKDDSSTATKNKKVIEKPISQTKTSTLVQKRKKVKS